MFPGDRTLYSVLGVAPDAPAAVIKAAYRALAKQYHPDGQGVDGASTAKFIELQEAYKVLSDEPSRAEYDRATFGPDATADNSIPDEQTEASIDPDEVWASKVSRHPEIEALHETLYTFSPALGNRFRLAVVGGECDDDPATFAAQLDRAFFSKYFGDDPEVQGLARRLLKSENRSAAKTLNKAVQNGKFKDPEHSKQLIELFERKLAEGLREPTGSYNGDNSTAADSGADKENTPLHEEFRARSFATKNIWLALGLSVVAIGVIFALANSTPTALYPEISSEGLPYSDGKTVLIDAEVGRAAGNDENITTLAKQVAPEPTDETFQLTQGETLIDALTDRGVRRDAAKGLEAAIEPLFPMAQIKAGTEFELTLDRQFDFYGRDVIFPVSISFRPSPHRTIIVKADEDGNFIATEEKSHRDALEVNQYQASSAKRVALVIGNGAYKRIPWLQNPDDDARTVAAALSALGFEVTTVVDASLSTMRLSLFSFSRTLAPDVEAALVYYSGHAVEIDSVNYLLPTDAAAQSSGNGVPANSISLAEVIQILDAGRIPTKILILDACRDNPLSGAGGGLATVRAGSGTFIAYSTEPGSVAVDGDPNASNSPYTAALVEALKKPTKTIEETFKEVRANVIRATEGKQVPWESSSLTEEFSFRQLSQSPREENQQSIVNVENPDQSNQGQKQIRDRIVGEQEIQGSEIPLLPSAPEPPPLLLPSTGDEAAQPAAEGTPSTPSSSAALPDEAAPAPKRKKRTIMDLFRGNGMDDASADQPENHVATVEQPRPSMPDQKEAEAQPTTGSGFIVQLASFRSEADARNEYSRLSSLYPSVVGGLQQQIRQTNVGGSTRYQLGLGPLESRNQATQVCSALITAGESDCVVRGR